ncbi:MAG TPA: corrinoid protein [Gaiellaceae bacterium]|nr:corrinoid protein [Gaiellaceae bacterium]HVP74746.1 corrinoid protein [Gaiellaceae bacterium]
MEIAQLTEAVIVGNAPEAEALTRTALDEGVAPTAIVDEGLIVAMGIVGDRFGRGEIYVPEMLLSARAMQHALAVVEPLLVGDDISSRGSVVIGTVKGDIHAIGKNIVGIMLRGSGFTVLDLGVDVPADRFVGAIEEHRPDILAMSALLTTTMPRMETVIEALDGAGVRDEVKVMVGGAPITEEFARSIGADGYGRDAGAAAARARELVPVRA